MNEQSIREMVSKALEYASVPGFAGSAVQRAFVEGQQDVAFSDLQIDSLAAMELCIAIEANVDVTILPVDLPGIGSLEALVRRIEELSSAAGAL